MRKDHEGDRKQYILLSEAWYADSALPLREKRCIDEVHFGLYRPNGACLGSMNMRWYALAGEAPTGSPRLECYSDGWHILWQFKDVLMGLAHVDDQDITPQQFCRLLDACGFTDCTPRRYEESYPNEGEED